MVCQASIVSQGRSGLTEPEQRAQFPALFAFSIMLFFSPHKHDCIGQQNLQIEGN